MGGKLHLGLKLFSLNREYIDEAVGLCSGNICSFIELYVVPGTFDEFAGLWKELNTDFIIHAPHSAHEFNLSKKEKFQENLLMLEEVMKFTEDLNARYVVLHPGISGDHKETIRQIKYVNDKRVLVENKPYKAPDGSICVGASYEQISSILESTGAGFCMDIGHGMKYSINTGIEPFGFLTRLIGLGPELFHACDGKYSSEYDEHLNIGDGDYDWGRIFSLIGGECKGRDMHITLETEKKKGHGLKDFITDASRVRGYFK